MIEHQDGAEEEGRRGGEEAGEDEQVGEDERAGEGQVSREEDGGGGGGQAEERRDGHSLPQS